MKTRGDLTINYVILFILALLLLVVVAIIFRKQIINFLDTINGVSGGLGQGVKNAVKDLTSP